MVGLLVMTITRSKNQDTCRWKQYELQYNFKAFKDSPRLITNTHNM